MKLTAKEKAKLTYEALQRRKKMKEYTQRAIENDLDNLRFECITRAKKRTNLR